ncbi:MAG TPA: hypothetical protein VKR22_12810, partial [Acidimicrobiales bacterium]|nr:hypothetical protein [Acidimicrobiales bacterium]
MTAKDYKGALLRGWRLLLLLVILGGVVGLLRPVHHASKLPPPYIAAITIEANPKGGLNLAQLTFYATNHQVILNAAQAAGFTESSFLLQHDVAISKAKTAFGLHSLKIPALVVTIVQPTAQMAVKLANQFGVTLKNYILTGARNGYDAAVAGAAQSVNCLQSELATIDDDIATETSGGSVDITQVFGSLAQDSSGCTASSSSGPNASSNAANVTNTDFTPSGAPATFVANTPAGGSGAPSANGTTPDATLAALQTAKTVTTARLNAALRTQTDLATTGPPQPAFTVLQPALVATPEGFGFTKVSLANNRLANVGGGALVGLLLAAGIVVGVETLDRSIRSVRQAEEAFELPVVGEIPRALGAAKVQPGEAPPPPRLDVALEPTSAVAEAYRRLRAAVLLEPLAAERMMLAGFGYGNGYGNGYAGYGNGNGYANGNGNGNGHAHGNGHAVAEASEDHGDGHAEGIGNGHGNGHTNGNGNGNGNGKNGNGRRVILVVSAGSEITRSGVIANLAAAYAETGDRALVVSIGRLGWYRGTDPDAPDPRSGVEFGPADIVPRSSPTMVAGVRRLSFDTVFESRGQVPSYGPSILSAAREVADVVLVDGPALLKSHDALLLLPSVDLVLVVAEGGTTTAPEAKALTQTLQRFKAPVLGVVLTNAKNGG